MAVRWMNAADGSGCNHTTLLPKRRTSPNVAVNGATAAQMRSMSVIVAASTGLRNGNSTVTCDGILRPRLRRWRARRSYRAAWTRGASSTRAERWTTVLSSFGVEFVVVRNPDPQSSLPFLVHIPLGAEGIVLKVRDVWPRTTKLYCHRADDWPGDADVVERVPVRSCARRGAAIDLVLDR